MYFNPRSREGSDFHLHLNRLHHQDFNPRSREGSDLYRITFLHSNHISIHAPAKGATRDFLFCYDSNFSFQSTLPRRERLNLESFVNPGITISIHAPAKGATFGEITTVPNPRFQSTLPRRERRTQQEQSQDGSEISIHAPAKGATFRLRPDKLHLQDFNPRSREGSDANDVDYFADAYIFQSTLPRRERLQLSSMD